MERKKAGSDVSGRSRSQKSGCGGKGRGVSADDFADALDEAEGRETGHGGEQQDPLQLNSPWPTTPGAIHQRGGTEAVLAGDRSSGSDGVRARLSFTPDATASTASPGTGVSPKSIEEVLAQFKKQMDDDAQLARQRDAANTQAALASAALGFEQVSNARFTEQQSQIDAVKQRATKVEAEHKAMWTQIKVLQEKLGAHERGAPSARIDAADDDRSPNPTFLKFRTMADVSIADVQAKVQELSVSARLEQGSPGQIWEVIGERRNYVIQFKGDDTVASARAKTLFQYTKVGGPGGKYVPIKIAGGDVYLDPDKSPKTERTEAAGRRLRKVVAEACPHLNVRLIHDEAFITIEHVPAVRVLSPSPDEVALEWHARFNHPDVDRAHIETSFNNAFSVGRSRWCG